MYTLQMHLGLFCHVVSSGQTVKLCRSPWGRFLKRTYSLLDIALLNFVVSSCTAEPRDLPFW